MNTNSNPYMMHETTCAECGAAVRVPFQPRPGARIYCHAHLYMRTPSAYHPRRNGGMRVPQQRQTRHPIPAKPCRVMSVNGDVMTEDAQSRTLYFDPTQATEFQSVQKARAAIWRTLQADRGLPVDSYSIVLR